MTSFRHPAHPHRQARAAWVEMAVWLLVLALTVQGLAVGRLALQGGRHEHVSDAERRDDRLALQVAVGSRYESALRGHGHAHSTLPDVLRRVARWLGAARAQAPTMGSVALLPHRHGDLEHVHSQATPAATDLGESGEDTRIQPVPPLVGMQLSALTLPVLDAARHVDRPATQGLASHIPRGIERPPRQA